MVLFSHHPKINDIVTTLSYHIAFSNYQLFLCSCNIEDYCGDFPNTQLETMERYEELLKSGDMSDVTVHAGMI